MLKANPTQSHLLAFYKNTVQLYDSSLSHQGTLIVGAEVIDAIELTDGSFVVASGDKVVSVFDSSKKMTHHVLLSKKPTSLAEIGDSFLVADKFGDVYRFKATDLPVSTEDAGSLKDSITEHIVVAHFSLINKIAITKKGNAIVTCDRDEKVRITRYPRTDIIQSFCYGFIEAVTSAVCEEVQNKAIVVCGGCDGSMRIFNVTNGEEIGHYMFDKNDVVIVYDGHVKDNDLILLVNVEGKKLHKLTATFTNDNNQAPVAFHTEEIAEHVKGAVFIKDDVVIYESQDRLSHLGGTPVTITNYGSLENLTNDGVRYETMRKAIIPKERFLGIQDDDAPRKQAKD